MRAAADHNEEGAEAGGQRDRDPDYVEEGRAAATPCLFRIINHVLELVAGQHHENCNPAQKVQEYKTLLTIRLHGLRSYKRPELFQQS